MDYHFSGERHLGEIQMLTHGGENAEAYFNAEATELIFQSTRDQFACDQIFRADADGKNVRLVSTGVGRTTCGFIFPNQPKILYSSSHATLPTCPTKPDYSRGYVWPLLPDFDIYVAGQDGENPTPLAPHPGYDAEGVVSPQGDRIVFTSTRSGDIDIWSMKPDGTELAQLTTEVGYDGGAFFSLDGSKIVYRANHPTDPQELKDYKDLLADDLVRPSVMDLWVMDADGSNKQQVLSNGAANFAPYFHPDGARIVFASNMDDPGGRNFDLYLIDIDGTNLERITFNPSFDAFPMFSHDGSKLVFSSNRFAANEGDTNVFVANWIEEPKPGIEATLVGDAVIDGAEWFRSAKLLADPALKGRGLGTSGLQKAGELLAERFAQIGLEPAGDSGSFLQEFSAATDKTVAGASLTVGDDAAELDAEFQPFAFSASGNVEADAVFVGFGITSSERGYDDYAGMDVEGKVAVAFRYEPQRNDTTSAFAGTRPTRESDLRFKGINARHHGAAALLVVNPPPNNDERDAMYAFEGAPSDVGIPVAHLTWSAAQRLFGIEALGRAYGQIESSGQPDSTPLDARVKLAVEIEAVMAPIANIVGKLPGTKSGRAIVVGAHYDHLGMGGEGSLAAGVDAPHLGADDNASGVASLLELAEALSQLERKTDIYFIGFTAEESGLVGSHHFVEHPPVPTDQIEAMINFDMVGRLQNGRLTVLGTGTGKGLVEVVRRAQVGLALDLELNPDGYGPSDQMAFYTRQIPVLHLFTGTHEDYHRPSDTVDKLNIDGAVLVTRYALRIVHELANTDRAKPYVEVRSNQAGDRGGDGTRGYGPYFGSVPSFGAADEKGVRIASARTGSPAGKAGLQPGDVIVKFGIYDVTTLKDYAFALRQHAPGDTVELVVMRDGEEVKLEAQLVEKEPAPAGESPRGRGHGEGAPEAGPSSQPSPH